MATSATRTRCRATKLYLGPGRSVSLRDHQVIALLGSERIRITNRSQVAELVETRRWNGACEVIWAGGAVESVTLDPRLVKGRLPKNTAWWRLQQLEAGMDLTQVGGPRQLAEALFGVAHKHLGTVAYRAVRDGRADHVSIVAACAGLIDPDDLVRILEDAAAAPSSRWWASSDPSTDGAALATLLGGLDPSVRPGVVVGLLGMLPAGVTSELARAWAADDERAAWIVEQAEWLTINALVKARAELGLDTSRFAPTLRARGIVAAAAGGDPYVLATAERCHPELLARCLAASRTALRRDFASKESMVRLIATENATIVAQYDPSFVLGVLRVALADEDPDVVYGALSALGHCLSADHHFVGDTLRHHLDNPDRWARVAVAAGLTAVIAQDPELGIPMLERCAADAEEDVRYDACMALPALLAADRERGIALTVRMLEDPSVDVTVGAMIKLESFVKAAPEVFIPHLRAAIIDGDREQASYALQRVSALVAHDPDVARELLELGRVHPSWTARDNALGGLSYIAAHDPAYVTAELRTAVADDPGHAETAVAVLAELAPHDLGAAMELLTEILGGPSGRSRGPQYMLAQVLPEFATVDPDAAATLYRCLPEEDVDIESRIALAAMVPGVAANPVLRSMQTAQRAVLTDPEAAALWPSVASAAELVDLAHRFDVDEVLRDHLEQAPVAVQGVALTARVIRSRAELLRNAKAMDNCTAGYADRLARGDVLVAYSTPEGTPAYNVLLLPRDSGWLVDEVNTPSNQKGTGCDVLRKAVASQLEDGDFLAAAEDGER